MSYAAIDLLRLSSAYVRQWRRGKGAIIARPLPTFYQSENFLRKYKIVDWKFSNLAELKCKIEILITRDFFCRKFAAVCRKIATSCPQLFKPTTPLMSGGWFEYTALRIAHDSILSAQRWSVKTYALACRSRTSTWTTTATWKQKSNEKWNKPSGNDLQRPPLNDDRSFSKYVSYVHSRGLLL